MTRSMVFTNTSNWDGEDYVIRRSDGGIVAFGTSTRLGEESHSVKLKEVTLSPGQHVVVYPSGVEGEAYTFEPVESKETEPFMMNGRQMIPSHTVGFE